MARRALHWVARRDGPSATLELSCNGLPGMENRRGRLGSRLREVFSDRPGRVQLRWRPKLRCSCPLGEKSGLEGNTRTTNQPRFQSAPPRRGRPKATTDPVAAAVFQSAPPRRGRPDSARYTGNEFRVSIRAPREGGDEDPLLCASRTDRFNPRPREGGDRHRGGGRVSRPHVSIRAPAKGATCLLCLDDANHIVSIRAPAKGATGGFDEHPAPVRCFNPRPAKGATAEHRRVAYRGPCFNPRPREGADRVGGERRRVDVVDGCVEPQVFGEHKIWGLTSWNGMFSQTGQ